MIDAVNKSAALRACVNVRLFEHRFTNITMLSPTVLTSVLCDSVLLKISDINAVKKYFNKLSKNTFYALSLVRQRKYTLLGCEDKILDFAQNFSNFLFNLTLIFNF